MKTLTRRTALAAVPALLVMPTAIAGQDQDRDLIKLWQERERFEQDYVHWDEVAAERGRSIKIDTPVVQVGRLRVGVDDETGKPIHEPMLAYFESDINQHIDRLIPFTKTVHDAAALDRLEARREMLLDDFRKQAAEVKRREDQCGYTEAQERLSAAWEQFNQAEAAIAETEPRTLAGLVVWAKLLGDWQASDFNDMRDRKLMEQFVGTLEGFAARTGGVS